MPIPRQCRLCSAGPDEQSVVTRHVYGGVNRAFFQCQGCDVIYQYPPLTQEEEQRLYRSEFEKFMADRSGVRAWQHPSEHVKSNAAQVERRMRYLSPLLDKKKLDVCEIGCSSGFMLYPMREAGHRVTGVEPSGVFSEFLKENKITAYNDLNQLKGKQDFDLAMHYFVLEHVADPAGFLKSCMDLVRKGGRMVFEVPNAADPLHSIYDIPEFERFYWSFPHHWYFSRRSLEYVLKKMGYPYRILLDQRYDLSNHMNWAMAGRPGGMGRFTSKLTQELEDLYRQKLVESGFCDTLVGIVEKA